MKMKQSMKTRTTSAGRPGKKEKAEAPTGGYRKGPWTEQEDMKLVWFVRLFGERRWDFLAKVSGLNRTGKSCRLRWVNYLHPDLKRGRMSPDEERLVVDLHAKWGNRWSRIAKAMPGRTDNEIKNYWRTHTRKHDKTLRGASATAGSASASASTTTSMSASSSSSSSNCNDDEDQSNHGEEATAANQVPLMYTGIGIGMDSLLWNDIDMGGAWTGMGTAAPLVVPSSPVWDYCCSDSLWGTVDDEVAEYKKMLVYYKYLNEIKNYWRTHTRKHDKTQRGATAIAGSASASTTTSMSASSSSSSNCNDDEDQSNHGEEATAAASQVPLMYTGIGIGMDSLLWNDIDMGGAWTGMGTAPPLVVPSSPVWDCCCSDSLWGTVEDEVAEYKKMLGAS